MTNEQLAQALPLANLIDTQSHRRHSSGKPPKSSRGRNVGDISCDPEGGLEFLERSSTLSDPFYKVKVQEGLPEVQMMAVDILPASIPLDASVHFSDGVMRYLEGVLDRYGEQSFVIEVLLEKISN
jgi:alpha-aminoadipic semialdehyde synthase